MAKARPSARSCDSLMANAAGELLRDLGPVMFCQNCKRAEMPGTIRCGRCGNPVERVRKPARPTVAERAA